MKIEVINEDICAVCNNKTCSFIDATVKHNFYDIRSETNVCPTGRITDGPEENIIAPHADCLNCGLCAINCSAGNLSLLYDYTEAIDFSIASEQQIKAINCSYLHKIFGFCANTNRNRTLIFDGYLSTTLGTEAFIEMDWYNDSLECVRRLFGDFLTFQGSQPITTGIAIFQELPKKGSRDVYELLEKLRLFPNANNFKIYFTTFDILRKLCLANLKCSNLGKFLFNPFETDADAYVSAIYDILINQVDN